jgi:hypothetical protein
MVADYCEEHEEFLHIRILKSAAGFYIGTQCPICGPWRRMTDYYSSRPEAQKAMKDFMIGYAWEQGILITKYDADGNDIGFEKAPLPDDLPF